METFFLRVEEGRFEIIAQIIILGEDVVVVIGGGRMHIGAIGIAQPRPSIQNPERTSSTSSVYTFLGHKEDVVVKTLSEGLSRALNKKVVVVAGIHWDNLKEVEILQILDICKNIEEKIIERFRGI